MNTLNIIEIGDVHYPKTERIALGDYGDHSFPSGVTAEIRPNPITQTLKEIKYICDEIPSSLLITGDITTKDDQGSYSLFVNRLAKLFKFKDDWDLNRIHVVPGNHDLTRKQNPLLIEKIQSKFEVYKKIWRDSGLDILCTKGIRSSEIVENKCKFKSFQSILVLDVGSIDIFPIS